MARSRPTLKDIAAELRLSHPTVSRALADHQAISDETKARIREVAERLGYVANSSARMLKRGHSNVVGLLLPDVTNEFYAAIAGRLALDCGSRDRQLVLSISGGDPDHEHVLVRTLLEARPSALIVSLTGSPRPETVDLLRGTQCIQFMYVHPEISGPAVTVEDSGGALQAVEHLLKLGHRRIGIVGPPPTSTLGEARLRGIRQALQEHRIQLGDDLIRLGPSTAEFGFEAVESLLSAPRRPTAIYLSTAPLSLGGMKALSTRKIEIPKEMSVVVAGSSPWYDAWPGGLTSITLPMVELADATSDLVLSKPARKSAARPFPVVKLSFRLFQRGSTAPLLESAARAGKISKRPVQK